MLCVGWGDVAGADKGVPKTCVRVNRCGGASSGSRQGGMVSLRPSRCALLGRALPPSPSWGREREAWLEGGAWSSPVLRCDSDRSPSSPGPSLPILERWVFLAVLTLSAGASLWGLGKPLGPLGIPRELLPFPLWADP